MGFETETMHTSADTARISDLEDEMMAYAPGDMMPNGAGGGTCSTTLPGGLVSAHGRSLQKHIRLLRRVQDLEDLLEVTHLAEERGANGSEASVCVYKTIVNKLVGRVAEKSLLERERAEAQRSLAQHNETQRCLEADYAGLEWESQEQEAVLAEQLTCYESAVRELRTHVSSAERRHRANVEDFSARVSTLEEERDMLERRLFRAEEYGRAVAAELQLLRKTQPPEKSSKVTWPQYDAQAAELASNDAADGCAPAQPSSSWPKVVTQSSKSAVASSGTLTSIGSLTPNVTSSLTSVPTGALTPKPISSLVPGVVDATNLAERLSPPPPTIRASIGGVRTGGTDRASTMRDIQALAASQVEMPAWRSTSPSVPRTRPPSPHTGRTERASTIGDIQAFAAAQVQTPAWRSTSPSVPRTRPPSPHSDLNVMLSPRYGPPRNSPQSADVPAHRSQTPTPPLVLQLSPRLVPTANIRAASPYPSIGSVQPSSSSKLSLSHGGVARGRADIQQVNQDSALTPSTASISSRIRQNSTGLRSFGTVTMPLLSHVSQLQGANMDSSIPVTGTTLTPRLSTPNHMSSRRLSAPLHGATKSVTLPVHR